MIGVLLAVGVLAGQQRPEGQLRVLVQSGDSAALASEVRRRPADARELLGELIQQAGRSRAGTDSILDVARRLASAYAATWDDSFPVDNLERFERLGPKQRTAKVAADSDARHGIEERIRDKMKAFPIAYVVQWSEHA